MEYIGLFVLLFLVGLLIFLLLRKVTLWYFRINEIEQRLGEIEKNTARLSQIEKHLERIAANYPNR